MAEERGGVVAAYVRVSSKSQDYAMQRDAIERAASARGDTVVRWYGDKKSGSELARSELNEARHAIRLGRVRKLYVFRLDRLTRSGIKDTLEIVEEFRRHGCELVTVADGFDVSGPASEVVLAIMAWAAKVERLAIGERIAAARIRKEAKGEAWGRPPRMDRRDLERAMVLHSKGRSLRAIAVALKVPRATLGRAIARERASQKPATKTKALRPGKRKGEQGSAR